MSGLEVVASIAGVASAAIKLSVTLNDIADDLGSAGRDVRYISNEMASFSQVLRLVHSSLEDSHKVEGSTVVRSALETLPQLLEQCGLVYLEANGLMSSLKPSVGKDSSLPFMKRVRFIFQKSRINVLRSLLDSSKSTLNLLLVTLNIEMAKTRSPNRELMDQLQSERKAFIRVVASQSRALDEALREVDKAKKEASKLKGKADKEKQKGKEKESEKQKPEDEFNPDPPPPLGMLQAPSVTSLVYTPPQIDKAPQNSIVTLALSLEAPPPKKNETPVPPANPYPAAEPHGQGENFYSPPPPYPGPPPTFKTPDDQPQAEPNRPNPSKRVFSDPGPSKPTSENLDAGSATRERSRSPYGFSRVPNDGPPEFERKRTPYSSRPPPPEPFYNTAEKQYGQTSPETEAGMKAESTGKTGPPFPQEQQEKEQYTYRAYKPPNPEPYTPQAPPTDQKRAPHGGDPGSMSDDNIPPRTAPPKPKTPLPPPPTLGVTYVAIAPYTSREVGHLSLASFDTLVDVVAHVPEEEVLPYPTAFDASPKHYWQGSLHHRRGLRGLFPHEIVVPIDGDAVAAKMKESWFAKSAHLIADMSGRVWVSPEWTFVEPLRRRTKWWAEEF